jgi:glutamate dehydrogenase/leucine dehydrogenase
MAKHKLKSSIVNLHVGGGVIIDPDKIYDSKELHEDLHKYFDIVESKEKAPENKTENKPEDDDEEDDEEEE